MDFLEIGRRKLCNKRENIDFFYVSDGLYSSYGILIDRIKNLFLVNIALSSKEIDEIRFVFNCFMLLDNN